MAFRKQAALALALASVIMFLGCTDELNAPTTDEQPVLPERAYRCGAWSMPPS